MSNKGVSILSASFTAESLGLRTVLGTQKVLNRKLMNSCSMNSYSNAKLREIGSGS